MTLLDQTIEPRPAPRPGRPRLPPTLRQLLHRADQAGDAEWETLTKGKESALTPRQYDMLKAVSMKPGGHITDIVERSRIDRSTAQMLVQKLEAQGFMTKWRDVEDRRAWRVSLTEAGRQKLREAELTALWVERKLIANLSDGEREELERLLGKITEAACP